MKQYNSLFNLPEADQHLILQLCEKHTYDEVVDILEEPRDKGGLSILTNRSNLCRFYTQQGQHPKHALVSAQFAHALQVRRESAPGAYLTAILTLTEVNLLDSLRSGKPAAELTLQFRFLKQAHSAWLNDVKARHSMAKSVRPGYDRYLNDLLDSPGSEYSRTDLPVDPGCADKGPVYNLETTEQIDLELMEIANLEKERQERAQKTMVQQLMNRYQPAPSRTEDAPPAQAPAPAPTPKVAVAPPSPASPPAPVIPERIMPQSEWTAILAQPAKKSPFLSSPQPGFLIQNPSNSLVISQISQKSQPQFAL